jgi:hypothetical protein
MNPNFVLNTLTVEIDLKEMKKDITPYQVLDFKFLANNSFEAL